jgi:acyl-CoA dehydrogenase
MGANSADWLVVSARTSGDVRDACGVTLFAVPARTANVRVERQARIDGRDAAIVRLDGARVPESALVGEVDGGAALLTRVVDEAAIGLSAEMLGGMCAAFETTLEYLKTRVQFGVPIGSFQALQHRAAKVYVETELARSSVMHAHAVLDSGAADDAVARAASVAKAKCSDAFMLVAHEAIQMHGGIGMTEEHDIGLFVKRARVAEMTFGDAAWHRGRFAALGGY